MGQGYSTTLPPGPGVIEGTEFSDLTFEKALGGARFLRTIRARHQHGVVVAKICMKANPGISFKQYARALRHERQLLRDVPNVLCYQRIRETNTLGLLVRQFVHTSLYDRISIRPFLEAIEKKWIAFQLLCAVRDCHAQGVFHGDIKSENVLVTSWGWVYLTDFASAFKPVYLPEDNPADFSYYYDSSGRRTCYIAPERFLASGQQAHENNLVQWNMDIFSLGCVIAELFTETPTFTLSQLFKYRKGEYDPTASLLGKIDDEHVRALISSMIRLDPEERWHASDYLDEYKSKAFPLYFYQHLHVLMQEVTDPTSGRRSIAAGEANNNLSDDRITRVYDDFEMLSVSLGYGEAAASSPTNATTHRGLFPLQVDLPNTRHTADASLAMSGDNGTFILLNVITSSMRSAGRSASKVRACELLLAFGERLPDEAKLDRILPYLMPLLDDSNAMVLVAALRTMTQVLALVTVASPVNSFLFTQYIFPRLQAFVSTKGFRSNPIVRATYAACLASLAETASRFLDMMQALRADGSLPPTDKAANDDLDGNAAYYDAYDATRIEVLVAFEGQTKVFLTDNDNSVRRAFLSSVPSLCAFLGEDRASDIILSHLNTYLNDSDWLLKCAFFKAIVGVAVFVGGSSLEDFILPLMIQALSDPQEFVVEQALRSLASMAEIGLLQRPKTWELIDTIARFQLHPNVWIREAASHFVSAATTFLTVADIRILVTSLVQPYLKVPVSTFAESELLDALEKPLPRGVLDMAMDWGKRAEKGLFWKSAKESKQLSYRAATPMPPTSSVAEFGPRSLGRMPKNSEDEQWLGRLRNAGMRPEDEMKILAFREYLWRAAQRSKRDDAPSHDPVYEQIVLLSKQLDITPQTVIFDNDVVAYEQRLRDQGHAERTIAEALEEATGPVKEQDGFKRLSLHGITESQGDESPAAYDANPTNIEGRRLSGVRKQPSGNLSSSPNSAVGLLGRGVERTMRLKSSATGLMTGNKAAPAVATDGTTAAGRLDRPAIGSRSTSRASNAGQRPRGLVRAASHRAAHNYAGNDPTVLKLLDTVYVENFPVDAAEFGPFVQPTKRGTIPYSSSNMPAGPWRPQGQLVAILAEHTDKVSRIAVAPDNVFFITGSDDGSVKVWDSARLERNVTHRARQTYKLAAGAKVTSLCFIDSTHSFVCTGSDGTVHVVKVDVTESANTTKYGKLRVLREWQIPCPSGSNEWAVWSEHYRSDGGSTLMLATNLGRILSVDLRYMTITLNFQIPAHHGTPTCFCTGRRHDWLLIGTTHGILDLWDLRFGIRVRSWAFAHAAPITRLQLHPSRRTAKRNRVCVAGGAPRGEVTVWDVEKAICHEIYRPALPHSSSGNGKDHISLRDYELRNLDEDRGDGLLGRIANRSSPSSSEPTTATATSMFFSQQLIATDSETLTSFAITGGPDGKVRFWDCDRLDGCRVVSNNADREAETTTYAFSQMGLDIRVLTEKVAPGKDEQGKSASRYEAIRLSAKGLLDGHLDTVTDVAVLERPFGMVVSADRSGQVFVHQ